jgi:hypothetical protein
MGQLIYGSTPTVVEIDDRALAHIRVVVIAKLRRAEGFVFSWTDEHKGGGENTVWIHPAMSLQFKFSGSREPIMNRQWLEDLMTSANSGAGLKLVPEREVPATGTTPSAP